MNAPPLTHHDILALAEPFARRGRRVDLAASDRIARRVVFQETTAAVHCARRCSSRTWAPARAASRAP